MATTAVDSSELDEDGRDDDRGGGGGHRGTQPAARGTDAHASCCQPARANARQGREGRHHAGMRARARTYLLTPAARSCWSCWLREELNVEARAHVDAVVDVPVPVGGYAGCQHARELPGGGGRGQRAARVRSRRRQRQGLHLPLRPERFKLLGIVISPAAQRNRNSAFPGANTHTP